MFVIFPSYHWAKIQALDFVTIHYLPKTCIKNFIWPLFMLRVCFWRTWYEVGNKLRNLIADDMWNEYCHILSILLLSITVWNGYFVELCKIWINKTESYTDEREVPTFTFMSHHLQEHCTSVTCFWNYIFCYACLFIPIKNMQKEKMTFV